MPIYDYRCPRCATSFEATHRIGADPPACPQCGGPTGRVYLTAPAIHGVMARGREAAMRSLEPQPPMAGHGLGCPCCH